MCNILRLYERFCTMPTDTKLFACLSYTFCEVPLLALLTLELSFLYIPCLKADLNVQSVSADQFCLSYPLEFRVGHLRGECAPPYELVQLPLPSGECAQSRVRPLHLLHQLEHITWNLHGVIWDDCCVPLLRIFILDPTKAMVDVRQASSTSSMGPVAGAL